MWAQVRPMQHVRSTAFLAAAALALSACGDDANREAPRAAPPIDSLAVGAMAGFDTGRAGEALPEIAVVGPDGSRGPLSDDLAEVTLVNLWATWCAPCVVEMPALAALQGSYEPERFRVVPVSLDRAAAEAEAFYAENGLDALPLRHDPDFASASAMDAPGLPVSVLYDAEGREIGRVNGPAEWDTAEARALVDAALAR